METKISGSIKLIRALQEKQNSPSDLSPCQLKAWKILMETNSNVFLNGFAGVGKSFLINKFVEMRPGSVDRVSSTGVSALLINGRTFHSFFGLNANALVDRNKAIEYALKSRGRFKLMECQTLIIDEVSMLQGKLLDLANDIAQSARYNFNVPWGGIRVIVTGDMAQLSPVTKEGPVDWAFKSKIWKESNFVNVNLKTIMRTQDEEYIAVLSDVRQGTLTPKVRKFLNERMISSEQANDPNFKGTRIFPFNKQVQEYNERELRRIPQNSVLFESIEEVNPKFKVWVESMYKSSILVKDLVLKKGALVMIRINDPERTYANGTLGHIEAFGEEDGEDVLLIKKFNGDILSIKRHPFEWKDFEDKVRITIRQFPVNLAWAITVHKAQGATLNRAIINLTRLWDSGQGYTALSRLRRGKDVFIENWDANCCKLDKEVINFYKRIENEEERKTTS